MIFNTSEDIKKDIKLKVSNYLKETIGQGTNIDTNNIISLLRSYLYELKIRKEVTDSTINDHRNFTINVNFVRDNETIDFDIDLFNELRKLKIIKIKDHDNLMKYFV